MEGNPASVGSDEFWWFEIASTYYARAALLDPNVQPPLWNDSKHSLISKVASYAHLLAT